MNLSIVIVNHNQKELLKECLRNIQEAGINFDYEIIVVDNASSDKSLELLSKFEIQNSKFKNICNNANVGFARGVNQGIKNSLGEYILILNPDVVALPGSIEKMVKFMEQNPECGICGPKLINPDGSTQKSCRRFPKWYTPLVRRTFLKQIMFFGKRHDEWYLMKDFDHQKNQEVDWLMGAALLVRRSALEKVGLMDERYFLYFEDTDWCRRFWQNGYKVYYLAEVKMYHYHRRLSAPRGFLKSLFSKFTWIHLLSAIKYFYKWSRIKA